MEHGDPDKGEFDLNRLVGDTSEDELADIQEVLQEMNLAGTTDGVFQLRCRHHKGSIESIGLLPMIKKFVRRNECTLHLNEKFLSTKTSWDFDANLEINDSN